MHLLKQVLIWLAGYRKYTFTLVTGKKISFYSKRRGQAIQKALDMEHEAIFNEFKVKCLQ